MTMAMIAGGVMVFVAIAVVAPLVRRGGTHALLGLAIVVCGAAGMTLLADPERVRVPYPWGLLAVQVLVYYGMAWLFVRWYWQDDTHSAPWD